MLAVIFVMTVGVTCGLLGGLLMIADMMVDRDHERRVERIKIMAYRSYVENCTARAVEPRSLPEMLRAWKSV